MHRRTAPTKVVTGLEPPSADLILPVMNEVSYNDASASAVLFSKILSPGDHFPPPDTLIRNKAYADMSLG